MIIINTVFQLFLGFYNNSSDDFTVIKNSFIDLNLKVIKQC